MRPLRTATTSARIESAVSSGRHGAQVEADRRRHPVELRLGHPGLEQPRAPLVLRPPAAHRADVCGLGAERDPQRRVVELRVVGEDRDVGGAIDAELGEGLVGPGGDHSSASGKRALVANAFRGSQTNGRHPDARASLHSAAA